MKIKQCKYCGNKLNIEEFSPHPHTKDKLSAKCKACTRAYNKMRYSLKTKEEKDATNLKRKQRGSTWLIDRNKHLKRKYGITVEQYNEMLRNQNGTCKICNRACKTGKFLAVDHCHKTGKVRGLLCALCNTNLGRIEKYLNDPGPWDLYLSAFRH